MGHHIRKESEMKRRIKEFAVAASILIVLSPITFYSQTPGSRNELSRCVASGRSMRICSSEGMGNGFEQLIGINLKQPVPTGLRMTGDYSAADSVRLIFEPEAVTIVCRGVPAPRQYTVQVTDSQALVTIQNDPKAIVFSLR